MSSPGFDVVLYDLFCLEFVSLRERELAPRL